MTSLSRLFHKPRASWLLVALITLFTSAADAQSPPAEPKPFVRRGDAVVTGFAATVPPGPDLPQEIHPLDRTTIDPDGVTVRIFDLTELAGGPEGQLADVPVRHVLKAKDVGHVFGIAFDGDGTNGPPNLYLTASSVHGLQLMAPGADGRLERVMTGRPGAQWMKGLFADAKGGGPGSIYKVDGRTGAVALFADIKTGDLENAGAGLGAIAFDPRSRHLYVSDMETGLVWRLALDGRLIDVFDHGTEGRTAAGLPFVAYDPATRTDRTEETFNTEIPASWGFAPLERRVWGLAVENERLYYAVADGPAIWSVGLNPDGSFAGDARREIDIKGTPAGNQIGSILFDGPRVMYLAQRGAPMGSYDYQTFMRPQEAAAMRYQWNQTERRWAEASEEYAVGMPPDYHGAVGGVALNYGYDRFGRIDYDRCRQTLWLTGEHLRAGSDVVRVSRGGPAHVAGLQGIYKSRVRPANEPPFEAWYVDYDATFADEEQFGHIGNVAIYGPCAGSVTYAAERVEIPVWTRGPDLVVEKRCDPVAFGGRVRCVIVIRNRGDAIADGDIVIRDETRVLWGPKKGDLLPIATATPDGAEWSCAATSDGAFACKLPAGLIAAGATRELILWVDTAELILGGNVGFRNCVSIDHPAGKGKACTEGGTGIVVSKTGPAVCDHGDECKFALTITNASPTPFKGPVLLSDQMLVDGKPFAAPVAKIEPPLACAEKPDKLPLSCLAEVSLAPGESLTHNITIEMPGKGASVAQNCFVALDPWIADKPDLVKDLLSPGKFKGLTTAVTKPFPACVWIKLGDPTEIKGPITTLASPVVAGGFTPVPPLGLLPPVGVCADGRFPLPGGRCPCPLSAPWDPETRSCRWRPACWDNARLAPDGNCCPRGTVWWASSGACRVPPVVGCADPWRRTPGGGCCPSGQRWRDGACRPPVIAEPCGFGFRRLLSGACIPLPVIPPVVTLPRCPDGKPRLSNGRCPSIACPLNAPFNPVTGRCQPFVGDACPPGQVRASHGGRCTPVGGGCPGFLVRDQSGKCVPRHHTGGRPLPTRVLSPVGCPAPLVRSDSGVCVPRGLSGHGKGPVLPHRPEPKGTSVTVPPIIKVPPKAPPIVREPVKPTVIIKPKEKERPRIREPQKPRIRETQPKPAIRQPLRSTPARQSAPPKREVKRFVPPQQGKRGNQPR